MNLTNVDYFIIVVVALGALLGFRDGLFKKVLAIVSFIIGIIVATKLMNPLGRVFSDSLGISLEFSYILAFLAVFMVIIIIQNIVFKIVGNITGGFQFINRVGGIILGSLQGSLVASLLLVMFSLLAIPSQRTIEKSKFYKPIVNFAPRLFDLTANFIPESRSFYEELMKDLEKYKKPPS